MELLIGAAGGLIAGGVLLLVEYLVRRGEKNQETEEERIVRFTNEERTITGSIFNYLGPRSSIELMKSELGPPNKKSKEQLGLFYDATADAVTNPKEPEEVYDVYVYFFKNATVKVTSNDGETIESLTVLTNSKDISFPIFSFDAETREGHLNVTTVTADIVEMGRAQEFPGCRDIFTAIQKPVGMPYRIYVTYFVNFFSDDPEKDITKNPEHLIGSVIEGVCYSSSPDTSTYIFVEDTV